jgi:hypothetical protein
MLQEDLWDLSVAWEVERYKVALVKEEQSQVDQISTQEAMLVSRRF